MLKHFLIACTALTLPACAGVSVTQLNPDMTARSRTPNGAVYYLPKPFLLVTRLPAAPEESVPKVFKSQNDGGANGLPQRSRNESTGGAGGAAAEGGDEQKDAGANSSPAGNGSGSSFVAQTTGYVVKLVYLPDLSRPMSITASTGLFGTAKLSPTFQDGWMLTGFTSEADNKFAEVLQHLSGVINAVRAPKGGGQGSEGPGAVEGPPTEILRPGLYEFRYDTAGRLMGLCAVNYFSSRGTEAAAPGQCLPLG